MAMVFYGYTLPKGLYNLKKMGERRPLPPQTQIFAKLGGRGICGRLKIYRK